MVWLLDMSVLQQYFVRLLSHTVHWAIHRRDLEHLIRHLKNGNYKFKHIPWNESYIPPPITAKTLEDDKPFLAVYNFGTKEMDSTLVSLLEKMNLQTNIDLLAGAPRNPRGNVQVSHGFTPVGHTRRQEHHYIAFPQARIGNDGPHVINQCVTYNEIVHHCCRKHPGVAELFGEDPDFA